MRKKQLGKTGIEVSEVAFGGVEIGVPYGIGVHSEADMLAEKEAFSLLHRAIDEGINFFDTARLYGMSEEIMGKAFRDKREQIVLASKCRHLRQSNGQLIPAHQVRVFVEESFQESLTALQTDYLDVYMVHYADHEIFAMEEVAETFSRLKKEGKVRSIGVSVYKAEETDLAIQSGVWDAIQLPFNLMDQSHGQHFSAAKEAGVAVIVRSVLMRGMLTDRLPKLPPQLKEVEDHILAFHQLLKQDGQFRGLPQFATQFALTHEAVSSVLVGIDRQEYLEEAVASANGSYFSSELLQQVQGMQFPRPEALNLAEWDKKGWLS